MSLDLKIRRDGISMNSNLVSDDHVSIRMRNYLDITDQYLCRMGEKHDYVSSITVLTKIQKLLLYVREIIETSQLFQNAV